MDNGNNTALAKRNTQLKSVKDVLDKAMPQIASALPKHMTAERMARIAFSAIQRQPLLLEADARSLALAVIQASELGIEPNLIGHAYLVPFKNNKTGRTDVTLIPGYKGLLKIARNTGELSTVYAAVIRQGDTFEFEMGLDPKLRHVPALDNEDAPITHVYAVAALKDGGKQFDVMTIGQVNKIKGRSRASERGPWVTDFEEMAKKTVLRRLCKLLPASAELEKAVHLDEAADAGLPQSHGMLDLGQADESDGSETSTAATVGEKLKRSRTKPQPEQESPAEATESGSVAEVPPAPPMGDELDAKMMDWPLDKRTKYRTLYNQHSADGESSDAAHARAWQAVTAG